MSFAPNLFLSNIKAKDGLARPARFEILLPIPVYISEYIGNSVIERLLNLPNSTFNDLTDVFNQVINDPGYAKRQFNLSSANPSISRYLALQCETTELPGRTLQTADVKIYGPTFKVPYQTQYAETTLTFLCTNDFYERKLFDRWMETIQPLDTNNMRFPKSQTSGYLTNIKVIQYDDFIKQIYAVEMMDAFPVGVAAQPLNWGEEGFHRLSVQFAYQKYRTIYDGNYDLAAAATELLGTGVSRLLPIGSALTL